VNVQNTTAKGTWRAINHQSTSSTDTISKEVFTLWLDHGVRPEDANYQYIVVPNAGPSDLEAYVKDSPIEILVNSKSIQAVRHRRLNRTGIAFYESGKVKANDMVTIEATAPCLAIVKTNGKSIDQIVVSDPSRSLESVELKVSSFIEGSGEGWKAAWD